MINLTISSLLLSSLSHSPLFAMNMDHKIDKSSFIKHFSTIFYLRTSLYCSNSNFKYLLSSLINNENVDTDLCSSSFPIGPTNQNLILHRDTANICPSTFNTFISVTSSANNVSISECLFFQMDLTSQTSGNYFIYLQGTITNCQFVGNCFSQLSTNSYLINSDITSSSNAFIYSGNSFNQITITSSSSAYNGVLSSSVIGHNLNIHNNNFSNSNLGETFAISALRSTAQIKIDIQYCDVFTNTLAGVICDGVRLGSSIDNVLPAISILDAVAFSFASLSICTINSHR